MGSEFIHSKQKAKNVTEKFEFDVQECVLVRMWKIVEIKTWMCWQVDALPGSVILVNMIGSCIDNFAFKAHISFSLWKDSCTRSNIKWYLINVCFCDIYILRDR
jgi:hypothetical protein